MTFADDAGNQPIDARLDDAALAGLSSALSADVVAELTRDALPAVRFAVHKLGLGESAPVGASRFGGSPDLPADVPWPTWVSPAGDGSRRPLVFFAQLDLGSVAEATDLPLPESGLLLFFSDTAAAGDGGTLGMYRDEHEGSRVLHVPSTGLSPRTAPPDTLVLPAGLLRPVLVRTVPEFGGLDPSDADWAARDALDQAMTAHLRDSMPAGWSISGRHQLGGHALSVQDPVEEECLQAAADVYRRDGGYDEERWRATRRQAADWRLLLQLDSDDSLKVMWGDVGTLYWVAHVDALTKHDWDDVWFTYQCS